MEVAESRLARGGSGDGERRVGESHAGDCDQQHCYPYFAYSQAEKREREIRGGSVVNGEGGCMGKEEVGCGAHRFYCSLWQRFRRVEGFGIEAWEEPSIV